MQSDTTQFQWALDIGNTSAKLAIFKGQERVFFKQVFHPELEHLLMDLEKEFPIDQRVFCNVSNSNSEFSVRFDIGISFSWWNIIMDTTA